MILHPDRYNTGAPARKLGVVVHTSESSDTSHDSLLRFLQSAGDRPTSDGGVYGSGYTAITDGHGGYTRVADPDVAPFHAPPLNATWAGVCIPGRAAQTRDEWLDEISRAHIRGAARFIVDQWNLDDRTWPLTGPVSPAELLTGRQGITSHLNVGLAWRRTNHTDPGPHFPWDVLLADVAELSTPQPIPPVSPEEDRMQVVVFEYGGQRTDPYAVAGLEARAIPGQVDGVPCLPGALEAAGQPAPVVWHSSAARCLTLRGIPHLPGAPRHIPGHVGGPDTRQRRMTRDERGLILFATIVGLLAAFAWPDVRLVCCIGLAVAVITLLYRARIEPWPAPEEAP